MKNLSKIIPIIASTIFSVNAAFAETHHHLSTHQPVTFLGPTARLGFTTTLTDTSAVSFAGEAAPTRNWRVSATAGLNFCCYHQFKLTAEYLWQVINYRLHHREFDRIHRGQNQGAIGGDYRFNIPCMMMRPQLTLNAYYSNAAGDTLGKRRVLQKRVSGSNSIGVSPGFTIHPLRGTRVGMELNYDNLRYEIKYIPREHVKGFGGTIYADQQLTNRIWVGASAAMRKPFNYYQADIALNSHPYTPAWNFRLIGAYTRGKHSLPSTYNILLAADYFLDMLCNPYRRGDHADEQLLNWMAKPAVYMPEVLGIVDVRHHHHRH